MPTPLEMSSSGYFPQSSLDLKACLSGKVPQIQRRESFSSDPFQDTQTASLIEDTMFDPNLKTIVVAHGNSGKLQLDRLMWKSYSEAANNGKSNKK